MAARRDIARTELERDRTAPGVKHEVPGATLARRDGRGASAEGTKA